jgi:uncharacterized membrane protein
MTDDRPGTDEPSGFDSDDFGAAETEPEEEEVKGDPDTLPSNVAAALAYVLSFATGVVFLILEPNDKDVRFHAFQSILLGAVVFILQVGIWILSFVPPLGFLLGDILQWMVGIALVGLTVFLMIKAYSGERFQLPYLGPRAQRLANPF